EGGPTGENPRGSCCPVFGRDRLTVVFSTVVVDRFRRRHGRASARSCVIAIETRGGARCAAIDNSSTEIPLCGEFVACGANGGVEKVRGSCRRMQDTNADVERVHRQLQRIVKARGALDLQEAAALREAQRLGIWRPFGYSSLVEYMGML